MQDIKHRELKMQEKRKNTPWREFVKELGSRWSFVLYKYDGNIVKYPQTSRAGKIVHFNNFSDTRNDTTNTDFSGNFFEKYNQLFQQSYKPTLSRFYGSNDNSEYADNVFGTKSCYLSSAIGGGCENILYSCAVYINCKNIFNSVRVTKNSENIFQSYAVRESFKIFYSKNINNSSDIWLSSNLYGCHECILCNNIENQSYCIGNKTYQKDEYFIKKSEILKEKKNLNTQHINNLNNKSNCVWHSENIENGFFTSRVKNGRNLVFVDGINNTTNLYDCIECGIDSNDLFAVGGSGTNSTNIFCSLQIATGSNIYYCYMMENCSYCLGCIGLKNKSFCILNKQYTKEERFELANKIFEQMDQTGDLGKFFPPSMNPFYFNDTVAYLIDDSFTKEEVTKEGYLWRNEKIKVDIPEGKEVVSSSPRPSPSEKGAKITLSEGEGLPQNAEGVRKHLSDFQGFDTNGNWVINPEILKKVIEDEYGNYYTIQKMELEFLQKYGLPLPEIHWLDRIKLGFRFK